MPTEGVQPPEKTEAEKIRDAQRALVLAHKRLWSTTDGKTVFSDLLAKYGFDADGVEKDDYFPGCTGIDLGRRDGNKSLIRYIMKTRNTAVQPLGTKPKKGQAKSAPPRTL